LVPPVLPAAYVDPPVSLVFAVLRAYPSGNFSQVPAKKVLGSAILDVVIQIDPIP
jgi:hypothetical protein